MITIMKTISRFAAIAVLLFSMLNHASAQAPVSPEYMRIIFEAGLFFQQKDFDAVMKKLDEADAIQLGVPIALNMRGAVLTETGEFQEARKFFDQAIEKDPKYFAPRFNLGEIMFLQKDYEGAAAHFENMLKDFEDNEVLEYKISLSYLMAGNDVKAREWRDKINFPSNTPAYYFAHAAYEFKNDNEDEGNRWISSSVRIFGDSGNLFFLQSLEDLGWVDTEIVEAISDKNIKRNAAAFGSGTSVSGSAAGVEKPSPAESKAGSGE